MNNYERLKQNLSMLDSLLTTKTAQEIASYLIEIYAVIKEDPNYYSFNLDWYELGSPNKGINSNYTHYYRILAQKLFALADIQINKSEDILSLLPANIAKEIFQQYQSYESAVNKYMEKTSGLRKYQHNGKWGYKDINRHVVIVPLYDKADDFHEGKAMVYKNNLLAIIDVNGDYILEFKYQWISKFHEGFAIVACNHKYGYINENYQEVVEPKYEHATAFDKGIALIRFCGKYGYINTKGVEFIKPKYDQATVFNNGKATVVENNYIYQIDKTGMRLHQR